MLLFRLVKCLHVSKCISFNPSNFTLSLEKECIISFGSIKGLGYKQRYKRENLNKKQRHNHIKSPAIQKEETHEWHQVCSSLPPKMHGTVRETN